MVELMVALLLGLFIVGGVLSMYLSHWLTYRTHESLARVQENARFAFELMMRETRDAGLLPCGSALTANVVRSPAGSPKYWWADTQSGMVRGFDDKTPSTGIAEFGTSSGGERVTGTDALLLLRPAGTEDQYLRIDSHDATANSFTMNSVAGVNAGDVVLVCDLRSSALLQIHAVEAATNKITYTEAGVNCSTSLGSVGPTCTSAEDKTFENGAVMATWAPAFWFIGVNSRKSHSLYRASIERDNSTNPPSVKSKAYEVVPDVEDLQVDYLTRDPSGALATDWKTANDFATWNNAAQELVAVRIQLTITNGDRSGANGQPIRRSLSAVAALRNGAH